LNIGNSPLDGNFRRRVVRKDPTADTFSLGSLLGRENRGPGVDLRFNVLVMVHGPKLHKGIAYTGQHKTARVGKMAVDINNVREKGRKNTKTTSSKKLLPKNQLGSGICEPKYLYCIAYVCKRTNNSEEDCRQRLPRLW